jgi:hypothetical protein
VIEAILNIPVLFFLFGTIAILIGSNIEISDSVNKIITLYLMIAIGIKGGVSLASEELSWATINPILIVVIGSIIVASYVFLISKRFVTKETAAAIAATYGSNSTTTFITAAAFLTSLSILYSGTMTVALVLMETPAIIYGIYLATKDQYSDFWKPMKNALTDGTHLLLIASMVIGFITVSFSGNTKLLYGFVGGDIFTGALCLFLLSMGIKVGTSLKYNLKENLNINLIAMASIFPWINGTIGYFAGTLLGFPEGDLFLTTMLMASASYIVAPAILERAVPLSEIGKYLTMSVGITFPINILIGIPVWWHIIGG